MEHGWIKLHRSFLESPLWKYSNATGMHYLIKMWVYLLSSVNYEPKKWYDGKTEVMIPSGSIIISIRNLAEELHNTPMQIRTGLSHLENMGMVTRKTTNRWTQVWIVNWEKYQGDNTQDNTQSNKQITNGQQTDNKRITTTKEYKNKRNKETKNIEKPSLSPELGITRKHGSITSITEEEMLALAVDYDVPLPFVRSKYDDLQNYCQRTGRVYKDYLAALRTFVKGDAMKRREDHAKGSKVAFIS